MAKLCFTGKSVRQQVRSIKLNSSTAHCYFIYECPGRKQFVGARLAKVGLKLNFMVELWIARVIANVASALVQVIGGRCVWERDLIHINGHATCRPESGLVCNLSCGKLGARIAPILV